MVIVTKVPIQMKRTISSPSGLRTTRVMPMATSTSPSSFMSTGSRVPSGERTRVARRGAGGSRAKEKAREVLGTGAEAREGKAKEKAGSSATAAGVL